VLRRLRAKGLSALRELGAGRGADVDQQEYFVDAYPAETQDTTGRGLLMLGFAWLEGEDEQTCLRWANICGALSTQELGGVRGFPTRETVEEALRGSAK
jgi:sugar/nucleoside kinase (ribokinase family)